MTVCGLLMWAQVSTPYTLAVQGTNCHLALTRRAETRQCRRPCGTSHQGVLISVTVCAPAQRSGVGIDLAFPPGARTLSDQGTSAGRRWPAVQKEQGYDYDGLPTASPKMDIHPPVPKASQGGSALRRTRIGFPCSLTSIAQSPWTTSVSRRWYETDKPVVLTQ